MQKHAGKIVGFKFISPVDRRRFISKIGRTIIGITGTYMGAKRFHGQLLTTFGGFSFIPYIGKDLKLHIQIRRPTEQEVHASVEFSGFILSINYIELVARIYHYKMGPRYLYKAQHQRDVFFANINDHLIAEISRAFTERLDCFPIAYKCLIHREGIQMEVQMMNPFKDKNIPDLLLKGRREFTKYSTGKITEYTGYRFYA